jgi:hypothetical protein
MGQHSRRAARGGFLRDTGALGNFGRPPQNGRAPGISGARSGKEGGKSPAMGRLGPRHMGQLQQPSSPITPNAHLADVGSTVHAPLVD